MPLTKCPECHQSHPWSHKIRQEGKNCIYSDPDSKVARRLHNHDGLPFDCPGCLAHASLDRKRYGKGEGAFKTNWQLTCRECGVVYYWCEGKDDMPWYPEGTEAAK